ncbi:MAG: efflux RND transporter permease subunit [Proteobacteria bacterium]|nr:efflux RND transporter permease subunit [Pseudomonadota bacterium]MBU1450716.1 efflux RND transporter permease subunit [Pseudomonadota bacterium]MBU2468655.1 efflux RND transporter permease subunit [Pseudomonadota bacterium]MBU2516094.1 efflux RND transporter permease subunit [Pseudomonadota bacterium]
MFLSNVSVRRPVAVACLIIALTFLGINSYRKLGLEFMPKMDVPYITITTIYPGASPSDLEVDVAKKIEDAVTTIDGLKAVSSTCMENVVQNLLEFQLDVDVDEAATDVRERLDLIVNDLPAEAERPKILKYDINSKPIIYLALTGDASVEELYDFADNELSDRLSVISGVAEVQLIGGNKREVQVLLNRQKLAASGLASTQVFEALAKGVRTIPSGRIRQAGTEYSVKFDADYDQFENLGFLEIAGADGSRLYLKDVGRVHMTAEEMRQAAFVDGRPAVAIRVVKKADANAAKVVDLVRHALEGVRKTLPGGMELVWVTDDGEFVQASVDSAQSNILMGILLTAAILFLFLGNLRSTLIVAISIPVTFMISMFFLYLLDYTLNSMTLMALGLSVGILVTNSIVVVERIVKRMTAGMDPKEASRVGAGDVAVAVLASAGTNLVVFFPMALMASKIGLLLNPFAMTMVLVTAVSLFVSFSLTPLLCSVLLRSATDQKSRSPLARLARWQDQALARLSERYYGLLQALSRRRWVSLLLIAGILAALAGSLALVPRLGFSFLPDNDRGELFVKLEYPTRQSLKQTVERVSQVERRLKGLPGLLHTYTTIGKVEGMLGQASEGVYLAQILLKFNDKSQRSQSMADLQAAIRKEMADYPGCVVTVNIPVPVGGQASPIEMEIYGRDLEVLDRLAPQVRELALGIPGVVEPDTSVRVGKPELRIKPNRPVLADLGVSAIDLGMSIRGNLEGLEAATFKKDGRTYDIRVKFEEEEGKDQVGRFLFPGVPGNPQVLSNLAEVEERLAPVQINRYDKRRVVKLFANLAIGFPLGTAVQMLSDAQNSNIVFPPGYGFQFRGQYEVMSEGNEDFKEVGILALFLTYLVLAAILESFVRPIIIFVTIPTAFIGVVLGLFVAGESLSIFVTLGCVMLMGIVVNNAILIMSRLNQYVAQGVPKSEAMDKAAANQLRPIIMITLAAILGMMPFALSRGLGSETWNGIGMASVGGIAVSAVLTIFVLPLLYRLFVRRNPSADDKAS